MPTSPKHPVLEFLTVENYRILKNASFQHLQPFTVLTGPHGAGKSTALDAVSFVADCVTRGVKAASWKQGWLNNIRSAGSNQPIAVGIGFHPRGAPPTAPASVYRIEIDDAGAVSRETLTAWTPKSPDEGVHLLNYRHGKGSARTTPDAAAERLDLSRPSDVALCAVGNLGAYRDANELRTLLDGWRVLRPTPERIRAGCTALLDDSSRQSETRLTETAANAALVARNLWKQTPDAFRAIEDTMTACVPGLRGLAFQSNPYGGENLVFHHACAEHPLTAEQMSDGTLVILALATMLHEPDPPRLSGLESPEHLVGPAAQSALATMAVKTVRNRQVIAATLSPFVTEAVPAEAVHVLDLGADGFAKSRMASTITDEVDGTSRQHR